MAHHHRPAPVVDHVSVQAPTIISGPTPAGSPIVTAISGLAFCIGIKDVCRNVRSPGFSRNNRLKAELRTQNYTHRDCTRPQSPCQRRLCGMVEFLMLYSRKQYFQSIISVTASGSFPMRACVQRVSRASVTVAGEVCGRIGPGMLVLLGVAQGDTEADARWLAAKIAGLRIFEDAAGKMNLSLADVGGAMLVVSQFTLLGDCRKGRRPASPPPPRRSWPSGSIRSSSMPSPSQGHRRSPPAASASTWRSNWSTTGP